MFSLVDFNLDHPESRKGTWLSKLSFYVSPGSAICGVVESNTLSVAVCAVGRVSVLCTDMCVRVSGLYAQPQYRLNLQSGKKQLCPPDFDRETPAGLQQPSRRSYRGCGPPYIP